MDSTPRRRARSTGPSRSGRSFRAGRGLGSARTRRADADVGGLDVIDPVPQDHETDPIGPGADEGPTPAPDRGTEPARLRTGRSRKNGRAATSRPAGTRPGDARSVAFAGVGRRVGRISAQGAGPPEAGGSKSRFAKQVAVLGLVFCAVALALAVPLRNYFAQRTALQSTLSQEQQLDRQFELLQQTEAALSDPAYIRSEAKRRLQYVMPGATVYVVHAPALAVPRAAAPQAPAPAVTWYSSLWDTLSDPPAGVAAAEPSGKATR